MGKRTTRSSGPATHEYTRFADFLEDLKNNGCGLLITGDETSRTRAKATQRLLGESDPSDETLPRRRILVTTNDSVQPGDYLPDGVSPEDDTVRIVSPGGFSRGATAASTPSERQQSPLVDLENQIDFAISDLLREDAPDPGVFRVGVTSLLPIIESVGESPVEEFIAGLLARVRSWNGMVHFHYPVPDPDALHSQFNDVIDARIRLRNRGNRNPEWLWHTNNPIIDFSVTWIAI